MKTLPGVSGFVTPAQSDEDVFSRNERFDVCAVNRTQTSSKERKELWVAVNLGWYLVHARKFNISAVKSLRYDRVE